MKKIITDYLIEASNILAVQTTTLPEIKKFEIDCSQLKEFLKEDIRYSEEFKELFKKLMPIKAPCLYWYRVISENTSTEIINSFKVYRNHAERDRSVPALNTDNSIDLTSRILYVGKFKRGIYGRVIQHLGCFSSAQTQGLQLYYWAQKIGLKLELNVLEFEHNMADILPIVEFALAKELHPLIGKHK
ncbi:MAG: hypothetical protein PHT07_21710 [Paludibacter sp.]|nr:hypothetical protein [Paludibacter sp.]